MVVGVAGVVVVCGFGWQCSLLLLCATVLWYFMCVWFSLVLLCGWCGMCAVAMHCAVQWDDVMFIVVWRCMWRSFMMIAMYGVG